MSEKEKNKKKLSNFFRIGRKDGTNIPVRTKPKDNSKDKITDNYVPLDLSSDVTNYFKYIVDNANTGIYRQNQYRLIRYRDIKYACTIEPLLTSAIRVYVNECYNPTNGRKAIEIHAKNKKIETLFYQWINDIGLTDSVIRNDIQNIVEYGDSFWANDIDFEGTEGVVGISPIEAFMIKNRLEFNMGQIEEMKQWGTAGLNVVNTYSILKQIYEQLNEDNKTMNFADMMKSYCLGYEISFSTDTENEKGVKGIPPWMITHTRLFTTENDFFPFGKPIMLSALPAFKSYRTTQMLIDALRVATFPKEHIKIKGEEGMDSFTRMERVEEVRQALEGMTRHSQGNNELSGVGERVYSIEDLFELDILESDIDIDKLGDLEYKRNDMVGSTGIPRIYLDTSSDDYSLGGESGEALKFLSKVFSRNCEAIREAELESITNLFRMHLMLTNTGNGEKEEFELSMPNPIEDYNSDEMDRISDTFTLAKDIIDSIGSCAGLERGETIDKEVVKSVMRKYLPVEADELDKWVNAIYKDAESQINNNEEEGGSIESVIGKKGNFFDESRISEDKIREIYLREKKEQGIVNGNFGNRTYFNNSYTISRDKGNTINLLREQIQENKIKRIQENKKILST